MASQAVDAELAIVVANDNAVAAAAQFNEPAVATGADQAVDSDPCTMTFLGIFVGLLIALPFWVFVGWLLYRLL